MEFQVRAQNTLAMQSRYLGVDPGLSRTGYALVERTPRGPVLREGGVVQSTKQTPLHKRVLEISTGIRELIEELKPEAVAIEQVFSNARNLKSSLLLAHARGAILAAIAAYELPIVTFTPAQIKKLLTGSGRAPKEQMQHAIRTELKLKELPEPHDVADASAIALCLYHSVRFAA